MTFNRPSVRRSNWRKLVSEASASDESLSVPHAEFLTRQWREHWGTAVGAGWSMLQAEGVTRQRRHLRKDGGRGWDTIAEYREAANRLLVAVKNFRKAHPAAIIVATEWDEDIISGWSRLAFPTARFWRRFDGENTNGSLMVDELEKVGDLHAAIDLVLLDCSSFAIVSNDFQFALCPYDGGIDFLRSKIG